MKRNKLFHSAVMETAVALESIDFQPTDFPDAIRDACQGLIEKADLRWFGWRMNGDAADQLKIIENVIKKFTGLNVEMVISPAFMTNAWVEFGPTNYNNVLFNDFQQKYMKYAAPGDILSSVEAAQHKGGVDISKATVTGLYAEVKSKITVTFGLLKKKEVKAEHIAAIIMHEVGHLFALFEYTNRQIRTNQVMAAIVAANVQKVSVKEFENLLTTASKLLGGRGPELSSIKNTPDSGIAIATVVLDLGGEVSKSALGIPEYDDTSFEMLADQFVSRHRYGRHLLDALELLPKAPGVNPKLGRFELLMVGILPFVTLGTSLAEVIGITAANPVVALILLVLASNSAVKNSDAAKDYTYDELQVRFKRIREQSIALLKDSEPTADVKEIISSIKAMDAVINKTFIPPNYLRSVIRYFSTKNRSIAESIQFQRDMEELAHNDLFLKAKELQTL